MLRWLRDIALICLLMYGVHLWQTRTLIAAGDTFPDLMLATLNGDSSTLHGESRTLLQADKPALVYVFAPWCGVCKLSIASAQAVYDADPQRQSNVVLLAQDYSSLDEVSTFLAEHQLSVPVLLGNQASKETLNIQAYPTYYLLDKQGRVVFRSVGYSTKWGLKVRKWLAQQ